MSKNLGVRAMVNSDRELNQAASALATAILDVGHLKGDEHLKAGVELERQLKRFAEIVIRRTKEQQPPQ